MPKSKVPTKKKAAGATEAEYGSALYGLAKELEGVGKELSPLYHLEAVADNLASMATSIDALAHAQALAVIAQNGTKEERSAAVANLKRRWLDD